MIDEGPLRAGRWLRKVSTRAPATGQQVGIWLGRRPVVDTGRRRLSARAG
jgi:hypothetical protein